MNELEPPEQMTVVAVQEAVLACLDISVGEDRETGRAYYDTFDGLLRAAGLTAVHEDGRLALVDRGSGEERAWIAGARPERPLLAQDLEPGPLREMLERVIEVRALIAVAQLATRVRALSVLDDERKTVVRLALEEPTLLSSGGLRTPLRPRVRLGLVRGYEQELENVAATLGDQGFTKPAAPLVDEAIRASGGLPGGISSKVRLQLHYDQRSDAAAAAVLRRLLDVIEANVEGTISDTDSEFLHDFRVSVRRSRAVQRELKHVFPASELRRFRGEFRWLQRATGDARDLDVYVLEFDQYRALVPEDGRADLDPLLSVLRGRRLRARREMVRELRSDRFSALLRDWAAFLEELVSLPDADRAAAAQPIGELAAERITKVYRRMVRMGGAISASSHSEDYHELRKKGKELRYLLELFGTPLYRGDVVKPMIKTLKALQDVLGRHQDREIQVGTLRLLRDEVSARPGGAGALMAMGVLVERLERDQHDARGEFGDVFGAFASKAQRALVKDTFA